MTVCIGGVCQLCTDDPKIILCCDTTLSIPEFSSTDAGYKVESIGPGIVLKWGDDLLVSELTRLYRSQLADIQLTPDNVSDRLKEIAALQKKRLVDDYCKLQWSISREEYLAGILSHLPERDRSTIADDIKKIDLGGGLIMGLFLQGEPFLFAVFRDGTVFRHEHFAVDGSGYTLAFANMYYRRYVNDLPFDVARYIIFESKTLSEAERHVGHETSLVVLSDNKPVESVSFEDLTLLDDLFDKFGPQALPRDFRDVLADRQRALAAFHNRKKIQTLEKQSERKTELATEDDSAETTS